jgi:hypothetical protein
MSKLAFSLNTVLQCQDTQGINKSEQFGILPGNIAAIKVKPWQQDHTPLIILCNL